MTTLSHLMCLHSVYYLQKNKFRPDIFTDFLMIMNPNIQRHKAEFYFRKYAYIYLLQMLSSNALLTFCGFRTLMTCVMVPVLNAGTMLLLGDRSCSWNVWREQRALFRKSNTLNTMAEG